MDWQAWLEDRSGHRAPVDQHFDEAIAWILGRVDKASGQGLTVLELGPGHSHELRDKLRGDSRWVTYHAADLRPEAPGVESLAEHWQGPYRQLPYNHQTFDAILAREVLEHVDDIYQMVSEIRTALKQGGRVWFSAPFIFPLHDYDTGDYWRLTPKAWEFLFGMHGFGSWQVWPVEGRELWRSWQYPTEVLGWAQR